MMPRAKISHFQPNKSDKFLSQCPIEKKVLPYSAQKYQLSST